VDSGDNVFGTFRRQRKENSGSENKEKHEHVEKDENVHFVNEYIYSKHFLLIKDLCKISIYKKIIYISIYL